MIKQPRGGYINKKELTITQLEDGITLNAYVYLKDFTNR